MHWQMQVWSLRRRRRQTADSLLEGEEKKNEY